MNECKYKPYGITFESYPDADKRQTRQQSRVCTAQITVLGPDGREASERERKAGEFFLMLDILRNVRPPDTERER